MKWGCLQLAEVRSFWPNVSTIQITQNTGVKNTLIHKSVFNLMLFAQWLFNVSIIIKLFLIAYRDNISASWIISRRLIAFGTAVVALELLILTKGNIFFTINWRCCRQSSANWSWCLLKVSHLILIKSQNPWGT